MREWSSLEGVASALGKMGNRLTYFSLYQEGHTKDTLVDEECQHRCTSLPYQEIPVHPLQSNQLPLPRV